MRIACNDRSISEVVESSPHIRPNIYSNHGSKHQRIVQRLLVDRFTLQNVVGTVEMDIVQQNAQPKNKFNDKTTRLHQIDQIDNTTSVCSVSV